jgi:hypothetical protein
MAKASRKTYRRPDIANATLSTPAVMRRDAEYRAFDGVIPQSGKVGSSFIPPCVFGKAQKPAASVKVKLFFAGPDAASEMSAKTGRDYEPGSYLRVCGPKTNDELVFLTAPTVEAGMRRAESVEKCIEQDDSTPASCVVGASRHAGVRRKKARKATRKARR